MHDTTKKKKKMNRRCASVEKGCAKFHPIIFVVFVCHAMSLLKVILTFGF